MYRRPNLASQYALTQAQAVSRPMSAWQGYGSNDSNVVWIPDRPTSSVAYRGAPQTIQVMRDAVLGDQKDFATRQIAESVCEHLDSKDYLSEYLALYNFLLQRTRYMRDPRRTELVRSPATISKQILAGHRPSLDCLPGDTLLLTQAMKHVAIKDVIIGDRIWGRDRWSLVQDIAYKGELPVDVVHMNNGSSFTATPDHKVYVWTCDKHPASWAGKTAATPCGCPLARVTRKTIGELEDGMVLLQPERVPFGVEEMDPRRALIEGYYLSDGWSQGTQFAISGQDGCPKEEQKREVQRLCAELDIPTNWQRKAIHIVDKAWTKRLAEMGTHAPDKHALSLNLQEDAARELLRGIMADSGANTHGSGRTFTTTSHRLFLQTRLLLRMCGISCGERFISEHGGLGKNPIWRLQTRGTHAQGKTEKRLRVKSIDRNVATTAVYDIQTDDHYVYLPHADVTVSNCDDMTTWLTAAILAVGGTAWFATVGFARLTFNGEVQYSHVFGVALEPRSRSKIVLDPVAAEKTSEMLNRVQVAKLWGPLN